MHFSNHLSLFSRIFFARPANNVANRDASFYRPTSNSHHIEDVLNIKYKITAPMQVAYARYSIANVEGPKEGKKRDRRRGEHLFVPLPCLRERHTDGISRQNLQRPGDDSDIIRHSKVRSLHRTFGAAGREKRRALCQRKDLKLGGGRWLRVVDLFGSGNIVKGRVAPLILKTFEKARAREREGKHERGRGGGARRSRPMRSCCIENEN